MTAGIQEPDLTGLLSWADIFLWHLATTSLRYQNHGAGLSGARFVYAELRAVIHS